MKYIGSIRQFPETLENMYIEQFHKHSLGWFTGTRVYMTPCPVDGSKHSEIFISAWRPESWGNLWRLDLTLRENVGVVAEVLEVLFRENCNLLSMETLTTKSQHEHQVLAFMQELDADNESNGRGESVSTEGDASGASSGNRKVPDFETNIKSKLFAQFGSDNRVSCTRVDVLLDAYNRFYSQPQNTGTFFLEGQINGKQLEGPADGLSRLFPFEYEVNSTVGTDDANTRRSRQVPSRYFTYSDTEQKYLCVFAIDDGSAIAEMHIVNSDEPGVWESLTQCLRHADANILASNSLNYRPKVSCEWKLIVDVTEVEKLGDLMDKFSAMNGFEHFKALKVSVVESRTPQVNANRENPFYFVDEAGWRDAWFGRSELIQEVLNGLRQSPSDGSMSARRGNNFLLNGYYKTGKSVLLKRIEEKIKEEDGILPIHFVAKGSTHSTVWDELFAGIARAIGDDRWSKDKVKAAVSAVKGQSEKVSKWLKEVLNAESLNIGFNGVGFKLAKKDAEATASNIQQTLNALLQISNSLDLHTIVVLVDEAQIMLDGGAGDGDGEVTKLWQYITQLFPQIRWIAASSGQWKGSSGRDGFLAKFRELQVSSLKDDEAMEMLKQKFADAGIYCPAFLMRRICETTGNSACYSQSVGSALFSLLSNRSDSLRVVDEEILDRAIHWSIRELSGHFTELRKDIESCFGADLVRSWMTKQGLKSDSWRSVDELQLAASKHSKSINVSLESVPAFVLRDDFAGDREYKVTPLFIHWGLWIVGAAAVS